VLWLSVRLFSQDLDELVRQDRADRERRLLEVESPNERFVRHVREAFVADQLDMARRDLDGNRTGLDEADRKFVARVPEFRKALTQYRESVLIENPSAKPLKELGKFVTAFNAYFKQTHTDAPEADASEFVSLSKSDLLRVTLTTAESVDSKLPQAAVLVRNARITNTVTVQSMVFLRTLHAELRRLDILISKLK
jgi:hypothetical protein